MLTLPCNFANRRSNRQEFDRTLKGKPQVLSSNTQLPKGNESNAAPAPLRPPTISAAPAPKEKKKKRKKNKEKGDPEVPAAPAKGKGKGKGKGDASPRTPLTQGARSWWQHYSEVRASATRWADDQGGEGQDSVHVLCVWIMQGSKV